MKINNNKLIKNQLHESTIKEMYKKCFGNNANDLQIKELNGGLKNTVYLIEKNNEKVVLKVAPKNNFRMLSNDKNNMWWEAEMMRKLSNTDIPIPKLILLDETHTICSESYIFMSYLPGIVYSDIKNNFNYHEKSNIEYQIGEISSRITEIKSKKYFLPSDPEREFKNNYEFILNLFNILEMDLKNNNITLEKEIFKMIYNILTKNKVVLNSVNEISLCNTDLWDGNILINDGQISGIVDLADIYFCDELMTFYFHSIEENENKHFLEGYGCEKLSNNEKIRTRIYRLYVILKMITDCELKDYGRFDWMYESLYNNINDLNNQKKRL